MSNNDFDTIVVLTREQEGEKLLAMKDWFGVRIAEWRLDKIKYIAFYQTANESKIKYYANICDKHVLQDSKYEFVFDGDVQELKKPIKRLKHETILRCSRYVKFKKLRKSKTFKDLF